MSEEKRQVEVEVNGSLGKAVALLKECRPLVARLLLHGVTITLSQQEETSLLGFRDIEHIGYSDRDWSYLRMASGVQVSGIAALNNLLLHYNQTHTT